MNVTLAEALAIAQGTLSAGRARGAAPLTVVVLDGGGHMVACLREDGSGIIRREIAEGKAYGALGMGLPSRVLFERAGGNPNFFTALAAASGPALPRPLSALAIGSLVFQTVVVAFASYLAWFWLVRHYPATRLASFTLLTPVAGLLFGVLLLSEPLTVPLLTGLLMGYLPWVVGAGLVGSLATLACAVGLLVRLEWARRIFIALLVLAIVANVAGLWLQQEMLQSLVTEADLSDSGDAYMEISRETINEARAVIAKAESK
jgi:uncharacterized protein GlcG (DUF336 family)